MNGMTSDEEIYFGTMKRTKSDRERYTGQYKTNENERKETPEECKDARKPKPMTAFLEPIKEGQKEQQQK